MTSREVSGKYAAVRDGHRSNALFPTSDYGDALRFDILDQSIDRAGLCTEMTRRKINFSSFSFLFLFSFSKEIRET